MGDLSRYRNELGLLAAAARRTLSLAGFTRLCEMQREVWQHQRRHPSRRAYLGNHYGELRVLLARELELPALRQRADRLLKICRRCGSTANQRVKAKG